MERARTSYSILMTRLLRKGGLLSFAPLVGCVALVLAATAIAQSLPTQMQSLLEAHNSHRAKHCVPPLTWSTDLTASAQQWANHCNFNHDYQSPYGENLFLGTVRAYSPQSVVDSWYEEIDQYDYGRPDFSEPTGHFTQLIWRRTKQLGCAVAACGSNNLWVCRYSPHGNVTGQFPGNVPKPCR